MFSGGIENDQWHEIKKKTTLWPLFMDGVQLTQGQSHFKEAVYFLAKIRRKLLIGKAG